VQQKNAEALADQNLLYGKKLTASKISVKDCRSVASNNPLLRLLFLRKLTLANECQIKILNELVLVKGMLKQVHYLSLSVTRNKQWIIK
jgi:hypothetical protein